MTRNFILNTYSLFFLVFLLSHELVQQTIYFSGKKLGLDLDLSSSLSVLYSNDYGGDAQQRRTEFSQSEKSGLK